MQEAINCDKCSALMTEVSRKEVMAEVDICELTDGQLADYLAAQESGDTGEWGIIEITYGCPKCKHVVIVRYV